MVRLVVLSIVLSALAADATNAAERHALIVIGAAGEAKYRDTYTKWHDSLVASLRERYKVPAGQIVTLKDQGAPDEMATAANLRAAFSAFRGTLQADDVLLVVLIGHGSADGDVAKFNIVGPDLDASQWSEMLKGVPGRLAVVNTTGASFPFLAGLSSRGRVVVTATDSSAQRFDTVFPEYFIQALATEESDLDKNGRVSLWEAFNRATAGVKQHYEQRGQLATERAVLDDDGDGAGKEAGAPGGDGALARAFYLDPDVPEAATGDAQLTELYRRRAALEAEIEALKGKKASMGEQDYLNQLEKLAVELARVSREIRSRS
jgi:hypothetical protein